MAGPKKNAIWTFGIALISQADTDIIQTSPTIAAGDITVSIDGGNYANIDALPSQIQSTGTLPVALTADEMNGDVIYVLFNDVAGDEWQDALVVINTETGTISEIDTNVDAVLLDTGTDGVVLANDAITAAKYDESTAFPVKTTDSSATTIARKGADSDTLETLSDQMDVITGGTGAVTWVVTINDGANPIPGADVWMTTDEAGANVSATGTTDASGEATFYLDAGTYYLWVQLSGYDFTNPTTVAVA